MATSNTNTSVNSLSDLANWVDTQLSIIIGGTSSGYSLGNHNSVWIDKGDTVFTVSLGDGTEVTIDSGNFNTAEEIAAAILATIPATPNTPATMNTNASKNGKINLAKFGDDNTIFPESSRDYPAAPYYVTNENKFMSNWHKEIDGRAAKDIYLCESWEEAQTVYNNLRKELAGGELANKHTNITTSKPRLNTYRNIYTVRYNDGHNIRYRQA